MFTKMGLGIGVIVSVIVGSVVVYYGKQATISPLVVLVAPLIGVAVGAAIDRAFRSPKKGSLR